MGHVIFNLTKSLAGDSVRVLRVSVLSSVQSQLHDHPRFLELKIRSGEKQVCDADHGSSKSC